MTVYLHDNYRDVLRKDIQQKKHVRAYKTLLAKAAGCHSSHLSQVLSEQAELTPEQAVNLSSFWKLDRDETEYFLHLVLRDRAGNTRLRHFYEAHLTRARAVRDLTKVNKKEVLPAELAQVYYSSWHYGAVHVLAMTPDYSNVEKMATRLCLPVTTVQDTLDQLERMGLIVKRGKRWEPTVLQNYLPRGSQMNAMNQINWRLRVLNNIQSMDPDALHLFLYSTISKSDYAKLKVQLVELMEEARGLVNKSEGEDAVAVSLDMFRI